MRAVQIQVQFQNIYKVRLRNPTAVQWTSGVRVLACRSLWLTFGNEDHRSKNQMNTVRQTRAACPPQAACEEMRSFTLKNPPAVSFAVQDANNLHGVSLYSVINPNSFKSSDRL